MSEFISANKKQVIKKGIDIMNIMRKMAGIILVMVVLIMMVVMIMMVGYDGDNGVVNSGVKENQNESASYQELLEGDAAPDFTANLADGSTFTLSEQSGKVVLLNFWATWCGPCVGEMPAFEKLYKEYGNEVSILAVNCLEDEETVRQFISENGYTFPIAFDVEGVVNMKYPTDGIPYTLVIGKDGTVQDIYVGAADADTQYQEYKGAIDSALGK